MPNNKKKDGLIMQAGILAVAGIIVRIIGLLYNTPLTNIIGDEGFGYYSNAYTAYSIVLLISSYSIPSAVSKVIAQKLAKREYRNAHRIFQCALIYVLVVGGIASLFVFFFASYMVDLSGFWHQPYSSAVSLAYSADISRHTNPWFRPPFRRFWSRL